MTNRKEIVIIGGGISGLSAAWEIEKLSGRSADYAILESQARWGGKIATRLVPGPDGGRFILDGGAESIVTRKPMAWELAGELGLEERVWDPGSETTGMYVLDGGRLCAVPLDPVRFFRSPLLSARGKLRMLAEPFVAPKLDGEDETLAAFASRRLGVEAMEKIIAPVLAGIYNADPQRQSILTTSPIMREMETQHGSLVRALVARMRAGRRKKAAAPGRPRFFTFKKGAGELTDRLAAQLSGDLRLGARAVAIRPLANGFRIQLQNGEQLETSTVLLAAPANVAAQLLEAVSAAAAAALAGIRHTSIGTAFLIYPSDALRLARPINGLMIPPREGRLIDAVTFPFNKMPERAPQGYTAVRVFYGRAVPEMVEHSPESLQKLICAELDTLFGIRAAPAGIETFSWEDSFPQADVGHLDRVAEIQALLPQGVFVAGASYAGVGVPDCVHSGRQAAQDWWQQHGPGRKDQAGSAARVVENQLEEKILHS